MRFIYLFYLFFNFSGSCVQLMVTIGVLLAIVVGVCNSWRWLTIACLAMVVVWALLLLAVPETPAYQLTKKRYREARQSLEWLRGTVQVEAEFEDIQRSVEDSQAAGAGGGLADLLKRQNLVPLCISLYLMLGQQLSGMNAVIFYVVDIFHVRNSFLIIRVTGSPVLITDPNPWIRHLIRSGSIAHSHTTD